MPVPVPRHSKSSAHPVIKPAQRFLVNKQNTTNQLLGQAPAVPPREEWVTALPSWGRLHQTPSWDQSTSMQQGQDFQQGLTAAENASVIKGAHAEACNPPVENLLQGPQMVAGAVLTRGRSNVHGDGDDDMDFGRAVDQPQFESQKLWDTNARAGYEGVGVNRENRRFSYDQDWSPPDALTGPAFSYQLSGLTPIFDDQSPGSVSGPDSGSSPMEPLTPFGDFIDRAVNAAQGYLSSNHHYDDRSIPASEYYQEKPIVQEVTHAAPIFPTIAEAPKQQDPVPQMTAPPSATPTYKKLSDPLAEWIANFVWKACTTGSSLPPAFSQPAMNSRPYAAAPPTYLAPCVQTVLLATLLQPSAVFLALWYMVRLPVYFGAAPLGAEFAKEAAFRAAFLGDAQNEYEREAMETSAPIRLVVLGFMLANKWLDDHTFSNKTWHSISNIPVETLNALESLALNIFSYDLSISNREWSQWLSHLMAYHVSLTSPGRPQPISRPSSNPHTMVRRALDDIMQALTPSKTADGLPQPVFLGLEERLRERSEKEAAMAIDALEIDLDEDGPLKEEYLPKRRASKLVAQNSQSREGNAFGAAPVKTLPPPAKWSPSGDEPILRDRNRSSGQYVAVQAPHLAHAAPSYPLSSQPHDLAFNQNWAPAPYMPSKQVGYAYENPPLFGIGQSTYNPFGQLSAMGLPHSRSQSLSYDHDNMSRNHLRSYSQAGFGYRFNDLRMSLGEQPIPIPEMESRWMDAAHYPYSGPAFVPIPSAGMQPAW